MCQISTCHLLTHKPGGKPAGCGRKRTSDSNFLNSSSFDFLYASISFLASSLASFTRFVRSFDLISYLPFSLLRLGGWDRCLLTFSSCPQVSSLSSIESTSNTRLTSLNNLLSFPLSLSCHQHNSLAPSKTSPSMDTYIEQGLNTRRVLCRL